MRDSATSSGPSRIRELNRTAALNFIRYEGSHSRSALGPALSLSAAAVSSVVNELIEEGLLRESEKNIRDGRQGRPISLLELNPKAAVAFGISLRPTANSTEIGMAWVDYSGHTTVLASQMIDSPQTNEALIASIVVAIGRLEQDVQSYGPITGVTIAIPGVVEEGYIPIAPKLSCIEGSKFIQGIMSALQYPVSFKNDVNLAATSELYQQPRLRDLSFAYLYLYSGIGAGVALQGDILEGCGGWAGEIGSLHINRRLAGSTPFERLLSTDSSLADLLVNLGHPREALGELATYIDQRDPIVLDVVDLYCEHICDAINVLNCVLDLDEVLVDFRSDRLFKRLRPRLEVLLQNSHRQPVISTPVMGNHATLNGAALTALNIAQPMIEQRGGTVLLT